MSRSSGSENREVTLQYKMHVGDELHYAITVDSVREAAAAEVRQQERDLLAMKMTQRITAINDDGSYGLEMLVEPQKLIKNGKLVPLDPMQQKVTMRMSKSGEILETSLQGPATQPSFPTSPLVVGQSWTGESKVNLNDPTTGKPLPPVTLAFNYKLDSLKEVQGYECAHIRVRNPESCITLSEGVLQTISATGDTYFAHQEGRLIKSEVSTRITMELAEGALRNKIKITVCLMENPDQPIVINQETQPEMRTLAGSPGPKQGPAVKALLNEPLMALARRRPALQFSVMCLDLIEEERKPPTLQYLFYELPFPRLPFKMDKFHVINCWTTGQGSFKQAVKILTPDRSKVFIETGEQNFTLKDQATPQLMINVFADLEFKEAGHYWVQNLLEDNVVLEYPLTVRVVETGQKKHDDPQPATTITPPSENNSPVVVEQKTLDRR